MKTLKKSTILMLAMGLLLFACRPDNVAPTENANGDPKLAGSVGDPHPALDTVCQNLDTMFFIREDNGSRYVDKCFSPSGPVACTNTALPWGFTEMREGYYMDTNFVDCNFTFAAGWYIDRDNWRFGVDGMFQFDSNGLPVITQDWGVQDPDGYLNRWQLRFKVYDLPTPCFLIACKVVGVKLNLFGAVVNNSSTALWAENRNWNNPRHPQRSPSRWLMNVCPVRCMEAQVIPDTTRLCKAVYTGLTCTGNTQNCTTLQPYSNEDGAITYTWSNGAATQYQTVCPTANTSYTVTISSDGHPIHIVIYNVKVIDLTCNLFADGANGSHLHGSGNHGCKHGKSGSGGGHNYDGGGGSGSGHHPGCNHNHGNNQPCNSTHAYGCNANHTSGPCNHMGHGYHCTLMHPLNQSCDGGHTRGCTGLHAATLNCDAGGGHKYRCNGQHSSGACNRLAAHTSGCNRGTHADFKGCHDGHMHKTGRHGNGSGNGNGSNGGHVSGGAGSHGSNGGHGSSNSTPSGNQKGVQVCHTPPGHPELAITMCVNYDKLKDHVANVCVANNGGGGCGGNVGSHHGNGSHTGGSSNGHNNHGSGKAHGHGGSHTGIHGSIHAGTTHGSNHHGGAQGNCPSGSSHNGSAHAANTHVGSGHGSAHVGVHGSTHVTHPRHWGGGGSGKTGSGHNGSKLNGSGHANGSGHGGVHGSGHHGNAVHPGDMIGACNTNPCL